MSLILALPSKGALYDPTMAFLSACGLRVRRDGRGRGYWGSIKEIPGLVVQFLRSEEIPFRIEAGDVQMGISGFDLYDEYCSASRSSHVLIRKLGFGGARLVVAVPSFWIDVESTDDLIDIVAELRERHGRALRVGTKFHRLTRRYFSELGIRDYAIVDSRGATEGMPASGTADIIIDLTSSGTTLVENDLKEIRGGTVVESEACFIVSSVPDHWTAATLPVLAQLTDHMEAGLRSSDRQLIHFTIPSDKAHALQLLLSREFGCETPPSHGAEAGDAAGRSTLPTPSSVVCPSSKVYAVVTHLREAGATGINIVAPELMFADEPRTVPAFQELLKRSEND